MNPVITVGLDGSPESRSAALWAAREAQLRHRTLRMLHAWILLSPAAKEGTTEGDRNYWAKKIVDDAQQEIHKYVPDLPVVEDLVAEEPGTALLTAAAESQMLVLGSRGMSPIAAYFLGDVGLHVVARATTPVVLVRAGEDAGETPPAQGDVVLGVGLHDPCDRVFEFAFDAAARRGVSVRAVHGRSLPAGAFAPWGIDPDMAEELAADARKALGDALRPWRAKFPAVDVTETVRLESPAQVLVQAAAGAALLVTGRRQKRSALAPPIGSVLQAALHHAPCPVAVVAHE